MYCYIFKIYYNDNVQIEEVIINHYKSIKDPVYLRDFFEFQILVGPNNAGKTNILDAINLFFDDNLQEERFLDTDGDVKITIRDGRDKFFLEYKNGKVVNYPKEDIKKSFVRIGNAVDYEKVAKELKEFKVHFPEEYKLFSQTLEAYFKEVEINEDLFILNVYADYKTRSIKRIGEGFKRLFVILYYIFNPNYNIILIDEPEIHLHPSIIKKFLLILEKNRFGNQIFFTTHHPTFVQAKYLPHIWRITRNNNNSTSVYGFYRKDVDLNRFVQEINDENSSMLFADKVLLVEGVSDAIFMREMINRFYNKDKDIKVVYTSGKGSVDLYAKLCDVFSIPYAVMLDSDALYTASLQRLKRFPRFTRSDSYSDKISKLQKEEIFILEKDLEYTYPDKYSSKDSKPIKALKVSQRINNQDINSDKMKTIKDIIKII